MIDRYDWSGGQEAMIRFGPTTGPVVIAALPLFEEANRTRTFMVTILRALATKGIASALPDLPGTGESLVPTEAATILQMQRAYVEVVSHLSAGGRSCYALGLRSGTLLDALGPLAGRWHFAPQSGPELLRELTRIKQVETGTILSEQWYFDAMHPRDTPGVSVEIAGNRVSCDLLTELTVKSPLEDCSDSPRRVVRLISDPHPADGKFDGAPLWRRSEPGNDLLLARQLADDIADWIAKCES